MGIDTRLEAMVVGHVGATILDPKDYLNWCLRLADLDSTACIRFIDPYGDTYFNTLQMPVLLAELQSTRQMLSEAGLHRAKSEYLDEAAAWPPGAREEAERYCASFSVGDLADHLERVIALVQAGIEDEPHTFVRFIGD